ncbi:MAG: cell division protein FtsA [Hyphomicrobiales bacterium]
MNVVPLHSQPTVSRGRSPERSGLVAALDIGSTKVCCLIGDVAPPKRKLPGGSEHDELTVVGVGHQASRGVHGGAVVDLDEAERAIRLAVDAAERMAGHTVSEVFVNVSGGRPLCTSHHAGIRLPGPAVTDDDVANVLGAAIRGIDPGKRIVLHATPTRFDLDQAKGIREPVAMYGERLGVELNAVTVEPGPARNLALAIERCHLSIAGLAVAAYAAGRASLVEDELNLGVTVIEMGGATTSIAVFQDGHLVHADVIPIGGHHITKDLANGLSTTLAHAERIKTLYGSALASVWDDREMIAIPLLGERGADAGPDGGQKVPRSMLTGIIRPRLEETLELVRDRLAASPVARHAGRRVVLSGGASQLTGMREMAAQILERNVRLGAPQSLTGLPDAARTPAFAVAVGLLTYALRPDLRLVSVPQFGPGRGQRNYLARVGRWLKESF